MKRLGIMLLAVVIGVLCVRAQGYQFAWRHSVRLDYLTEGGRALRYWKPLDLPLPVYPADLVRVGIPGSATVRFVIDREGRVGDIVVVNQSQDEFGIPSKEAVSKWRFGAPSKDAAPAISPIECRFTFRPDEE